MRRLACLVVAGLVLSVLFAGFGTRSQAASMPLFGPGFIDLFAGDWVSYQLPLFRQMRGEIARVPISPEFGANPNQLQDVIDAGAKQIVLQDRGCDVTPANVRSDFQGRGFEQFVASHPSFPFFLELGNEPNVCGLTGRQAAEQANTTRQALHDLDMPNLAWMPSLPTNPDSAGDELAHLDLNAFDALAVHLYGDFHLGDSAGWQDVLRQAQQTGKPLYLTEVGINDPGTNKAEKARRILAYPYPTQVKGVMLFAIADKTDNRWPQYTIDAGEAGVLAGRQGQDCRYFPETQHSLCGDFLAYWQAHGGLAQFGYPLTDAEPHVCNADGWCGTTQVTERAVFEAHPENSPPYNVLLRRLGAEWLATHPHP